MATYAWNKWQENGFGLPAAADGKVTKPNHHFSGKIPQRTHARGGQVEPVLGSRFTDSRFLTTVADEHGNRANRANDEGRRADHSDDNTEGIDGRALQQILERPGGCRILGDSIENDVQNDEENKTEYTCQEEEYELLCGSPGVDECKDKGSRCKEG
jgi:hypothetical protein